ncbi:MAG: alkaline phosphatase family protein [Acidimicrobiales bacterium]|nr:alkaline phosphatase family protein [Acidimicrobiales bacterium]
MAELYPVLPDYQGACITNVMGALLEPSETVPSWLPEPAIAAEQVVLLVLDGLGWLQLEQRRHLAPTISSLAGGRATTVAPSTTSTALTSITTGLPPGEHGVIGYRMDVGGDVLNVLRWAVDNRDVRATITPASIQGVEPFAGHRPAIVTRAEFRDSGFSRAHLDGTRFAGYRVCSTQVVEVARFLRQDEPFVYTYYDGLDKVSHEYGLTEFYDAELAACDQLVADLLDVLPPGAALVVTSDHGQVHVGDNVVELAPEVASQLAGQSGEGRFRWLHARPGRVDALLDAATEHHRNDAWVVTRDQVIEEGWFGPKVTDAARERLGDVALVARTDVAFFDARDTGPYLLVGRHGSLTAAEMLVPILAGGPR